MKKIVGLPIIFILFFVACKKVRDRWDDTLYSGLIRIACDENFKGLMNSEIEVFESHYPKAIILPIYTNEQEAIRLLIEDSVRFALTTRDLYVQERKILEKHFMKEKKYLIAFEGIVFIGNRTNQDSIISWPIFQKVLMGQMTKWSQFNSYLSLGTICFSYNANSSVLRYLVDYIPKQASSILYAVHADSEVIKKVIQYPYLIGIIGVNAFDCLYDKYKNEIRFIRISREESATIENSYSPYANDIQSENYPLWRPVYVLLSDPRNGLSSTLSLFLSSEIGKIILSKSGLLPITGPRVISVNVQ